MKKTFTIAGILALTITPKASFAHHIEPKESEIRQGGFLYHTNLSDANLMDADLSGANLSNANLSFANLSGIDSTNLRGCPLSLPSGWVCEKNSLDFPNSFRLRFLD